MPVYPSAEWYLDFTSWIDRLHPGDRRCCYRLLVYQSFFVAFFFTSRRRHTRSLHDWSSDVCSSDLRSRDRCRGSRRSPLPPCRRGSPPCSSHSLYVCDRGSRRLADPAVAERPHVVRRLASRPQRSEERRVGKECSSRWSQAP